MRVTIFGATGALGRECVTQCLEARHEVTVLARTPSKLSGWVRERVSVVEGDGLDAAAVADALPSGTDAILFAIGIDRRSPEDLCTTSTRHILDTMKARDIGRFVWCGGGSTLVPADSLGFGAKFVEAFARNFMGLRHRDKIHQWELLNQNLDVDWFGIRPLQMNEGPKRGAYRLGYDRFGPFSKIHFPDCAHAMLGMLTDDTWRHAAPIIQY